MKITAKPAPATLPRTPLLILPVAEGSTPRAPKGIGLPNGFLEAFEAKPRKTAVTWTSRGPAERLLLVGLGQADAVDAEGLRRAAAVAVRQAESLGVARTLLWVDRAVARLAGGAAVVGRALAEGARLGAYRYVEMKSKSEAPSLKSVQVVGGDASLRRAVRKGVLLADACAYTRDLQNRPGNELPPTRFAAEARKLARRSPRVTCRVLDEKAMAQQKMGLLLSVSQGSTQPARLIHLTYRPKGKSRGKVCFVGKGLTFDAGGISIKPSAKMDEMRYDMSGGAAVLGVFHALGDLDVPYEVHGVVPASENLIDGGATKPGDVHRAMDGTTVEVNNTDAEGRLILADALCYARKKIRADTTIDLATLTGAVIIGLGHELSGAYPSTDKLRDELVAAGEAVGELVWPLPLLPVHKEAMKGRSADLTNISSPAVGGGSITGAAFLSYFVDPEKEWCHLDIAGTAWGTTSRDWVGGPQGTGVGARLLFEYLETRKR